MWTDSEDVILRLIMGPWVIFYFLRGLNVLAYRASSSYFFFFFQFWFFLPSSPPPFLVITSQLHFPNVTRFLKEWNKIRKSKNVFRMMSELSFEGHVGEEAGRGRFLPKASPVTGTGELGGGGVFLLVHTALPTASFYLETPICVS